MGAGLGIECQCPDGAWWLLRAARVLWGPRGMGTEWIRGVGAVDGTKGATSPPPVRPGRRGLTAAQMISLFSALDTVGATAPLRK